MAATKLTYGGQYAQEIRDRIGRMRKNAAANIEEAVVATTAAVKAGKKALVYCRMHSAADLDPGRPGRPTFFGAIKNVKKPEELRANVAKDAAAGDVVIIVSELASHVLEVEVGAAAKAAGAKVVSIGHQPPKEFIGGANRDADGRLLRDVTDIFIDTEAGDKDGVVEIKGLPWPVSPTTGTLSIATFWAIAAETAKRLAEAGQKVEVA